MPRTPATGRCNPAARWASCPRSSSSAGRSCRPSFIALPPAQRAGLDLLSAADILVIRDVAVPDLLPVVAARRREGRLTVYEPGARLFAPSSTNAGGDLAARSLPAQLARLADGVQVGGFGLDAQLDAVNPRRARFPSQLWEMPAASTAGPRRRPGHRLDGRRGRARGPGRRAPGAGRHPGATPRGAGRRPGRTRDRRGPGDVAQRPGDAGGRWHRVGQRALSGRHRHRPLAAGGRVARPFGLGRPRAGVRGAWRAGDRRRRRPVPRVGPRRADRPRLP